jgi:hypothetical protein
MARWRVHILGKRAEYLGVVSAPNQQAATVEAIKLFHIPKALEFKLAVSKLDERERV